MNPRRNDVSTRRLAATIGVTLAGLPVVLAARAVLMHPAIFVWVVFVGVLVWAVTATVRWFTWAERAVDAETDLLWLRPENEQLHRLLTEAEQGMTAVPLVRPVRPGLHVVKPIPTQRTGDEDLPTNDLDDTWLDLLTSRPNPFGDIS